jgi:hypothetical protein
VHDARVYSPSGNLSSVETHARELSCSGESSSELISRRPQSVAGVQRVLETLPNEP